MNYTERKIVAAYTDLLEGLNRSIKEALITKLRDSLSKNEGLKERQFYNSFGAWESKKLLCNK